MRTCKKSNETSSNLHLVYLQLACIFIYFGITPAIACNSSSTIALKPQIMKSKITNCRKTNIFVTYKKLECNTKHEDYLNTYLEIVESCNEINKTNRYANDLLKFYTDIRFHCDAWMLRGYVDLTSIPNVDYLANAGNNCLYSMPQSTSSKDNLLSEFRNGYIEYLKKYINHYSDRINKFGPGINSDNRICKGDLRNCRGKLLSNWQQSFYRLPNADSKRANATDAAKDIADFKIAYEWKEFHEFAEVHISGTKTKTPETESDIASYLQKVNDKLNR